MSARCWDRRRAKQRERYAWPHASTPAWIDLSRYISSFSFMPSPEVEDFIRQTLGVEPAPWSRPDADVAGDIIRAGRRGHRPVAVWLDEVVAIEAPEGYDHLGVWQDEVREVDPDA